MAHIEQPDLLTDTAVLGNQPFVLDGKLPATEVDQPCTGFVVEGVERRTAQGHPGLLTKARSA